MRAFLERISSRKFLTVAAVEIAALVGLFVPTHATAVSEAATRIACLGAMVLAALGYGVIEAAVDKASVDKKPTEPEE